MTKSPSIATLDTVFVARFYRNGNLIHAQKGTITEIAALCARTGNTADLAIGDGDAIGQMMIHGRVAWFVSGDFCASGMHKAGECSARSPSLCTGAA